jgi:hypothetical protein
MDLTNTEWNSGSIAHLLDDQIDHTTDSAAGSFIDSAEYCSAMLKAENEAMKIIMGKKSALLPKAIIALINKVDDREIHNHLTVFFCRLKLRRSLLSNWQLKRFLVDSNYILNHLGLKPLSYVDKGVRVSRKAMSIVESLGPKVIVEKEIFSCKTKKTENILNELMDVVNSGTGKPSKKRKASERIEKILTARKKTVDFLKNYPERAKEIMIEKVKIASNNMVNPVCKIAPKKHEIESLKRSMDKVKLNDIQYTQIDEKLRSECVESHKKQVKSKMFMDYKNALLKSTKDNLKEAYIKMCQMRNVVRDPNILDESLKDKRWVPNDFKNEKVFDFGLMETMDIGGPQLVIQASAIYKEMKRSVEEDFSDYKKLSDINYRNKKERVLREEAAEKAQSLLKSCAKLYTFSKLLNKVDVEEYERLDFSSRIVESDFFKNEAIRRSVIDLEHKRRNFNAFKLNRSRKHRIRSMLDVFFSTSTIPRARKRAYGDSSIPTEEVEVYLTKDFEVIMGELLRIRPDHFMYNDIDEYTEPIPYRKFTTNGVEIRSVGDIKYKKFLGVKRKGAPDNYSKKGKIKCNHYKGLPKCYVADKLNNWFERIIDKLELDVVSRDDKMNDEKRSIMEEIESIKQKIQDLQPVVTNSVSDLDSYYDELELIVNKGMKLYLTLEELSSRINAEIKEKWLKSRIEQEEIVLRTKIEQLEMMGEYNSELAKLKETYKDVMIIQNTPEVNKLFNDFKDSENYDNAIFKKASLQSIKDSIGKERANRIELIKIKSEKDLKEAERCKNQKAELKKRMKKLNTKLKGLDQKYELIRENQEKHWESLKKKRKIIRITGYNSEIVKMKEMLLSDRNLSKAKLEAEKRNNVWKLRIKELERQEEEKEREIPSWSIEETKEFFESNKESQRTMLFKSVLDKSLKVTFKIE